MMWWKSTILIVLIRHLPEDLLWYVTELIFIKLEHLSLVLSYSLVTISMVIVILKDAYEIPYKKSHLTSSVIILHVSSV